MYMYMYIDIFSTSLGWYNTECCPLWPAYTCVCMYVCMYVYVTPVVQVRELEGDMQDLVYKVRDLEKTNLSLRNEVYVHVHVPV